MNDLAAVDSTIDLVNVPFMKHYVQRPAGGETVPRARLVSYIPEDEPVLSYGVSRNPDLVMGGAGVVSE
jgi:hypothetical protein